MATLVRQRIIEEGLVPTKTTLGETNDFANTGREFILYTNSSGESKTITVTTEVETVDSPTWGDLTKSDAENVVVNGATVVMGPFPVDSYNDSDGMTAFTVTPFDEGVDDASLLYI